ncbi:MAG: AzlC family ABC transporter permease [Ruminococcaceae bacterium]|nr:AzlC family ABC transporter permease [Oscillospiraceae bacterium]
MNSLFRKGLYHGIPIALGYLSVSFGFGIMSVRLGLGVLDTVIISLTNLTSAGQAAGVGIIAAGGGLIEMIMTQLVINLRYALMALSLSQKLGEKFNTPRRMIVAFGITDEIFAVSSVQKGKIQPIYMYGLILISAVGWTLGTFLGAAAGSILPQMITDAMGLVLYGMFLAIIIPPARENKSVLFVVAVAAGISILFYYVFTFVSSGFAIIISAVGAALLGAWLFPIPNEEAEQA